MTLKQFVEAYKENIEFSVKELVDEALVEIVSFNASELDAIKDTITAREVSKYYVEVINKVSAVARIVVILKAA